MAIVIKNMEQFDPVKVSAFEKAYKTGEFPEEEEAVLATSGEMILAEGTMLVAEKSPHRAQLYIVSGKETEKEAIKGILEEVIRRAKAQEVTLLLYFAPAGDEKLEEVLDKEGFTSVGEIPGYFRTNGTYGDAVLFIRDFRNEEESGEDHSRGYIEGMIRDGYDDGNIAYFLDVEVEKVQLVRRELGIPEPE